MNETETHTPCPHCNDVGWIKGADGRTATECDKCHRGDRLAREFRPAVPEAKPTAEADTPGSPAPKAKPALKPKVKKETPKPEPTYAPSPGVSALGQSLARIKRLDAQVFVLDTTTPGTSVAATPGIAGFVWDAAASVKVWSDDDLTSLRKSLRDLLDLEVKELQGIIKKKMKWGGGAEPAPKKSHDDEENDDDYDD